MKTINFQGKQIFYHDKGEGKTIVLLHGFTESSSIWKTFTGLLSREFRVIAIDLPGHGKSECIGKIHTMELQADVVHAVLKQEKVKKCLLVGHSMGGYVALSFAGKYPEMLKGFGLFHSHSFADSAEDRKNRERTISLVNQDKFEFITSFIPDLFPAEVRGKFSKEIKELVAEAGKMKKEAVIAALEGMKVREDQKELLRMTSLPVLFILGLKDPRTPLSRISEMISLPAHSELLLLRDAGHMGYFEAPEETFEMVRGFARKVLTK
ncbi:MAG: alpha/beta hydrolase [Bacteroidetes bacterium]|nr:alpha/beta hydrolase [Bacteroidota bacterium]